MLNNTLYLCFIQSPDMEKIDKTLDQVLARAELNLTKLEQIHEVRSGNTHTHTHQRKFEMRTQMTWIWSADPDSWSGRTDWERESPAGERDPKNGWQSFSSCRKLVMMIMWSWWNFYLSEVFLMKGSDVFKKQEGRAVEPVVKSWRASFH